MGPGIKGWRGNSSVSLTSGDPLGKILLPDPVILTSAILEVLVLVRGHPCLETHSKHAIHLEAQISPWSVWASDTLKTTGEERNNSDVVCVWKRGEITMGKLGCFSERLKCRRYFGEAFGDTPIL